MMNIITEYFFVLLRFISIPLLSSCVGYEVIDKQVYFKTWDEANGKKKIEVSADVETFEILKFKDWAKDKNNVFYRGVPLEGADPTSFVALSKRYVKDNNFAWYGFNIIEGADGESFRLLDGGYAADINDLYYMRKALGSAYPHNYKIIYKNKRGSAEWITDGQYYYYYSTKVPSDDFENVTIYLGSDGIATDLKWAYYGGHKMNHDRKGNQIIDSIDIATFEVTNYIDCRDKSGCISVVRGRVDCDENAKIMPIKAVKPSGKEIE